MKQRLGGVCTSIPTGSKRFWLVTQLDLTNCDLQRQMFFFEECIFLPVSIGMAAAALYRGKRLDVQKSKMVPNKYLVATPTSPPPPPPFGTWATAGSGRGQ